MRLLFRSVLYITTAMLILPPDCGGAAGIRAKRAIAFRDGSTFFYRLNYKLSSIGTTTIFAQATGFKVSWPLPTRNMGRRYRRNVDDVYESAELMYESHGFDGKTCVAKNICQALAYANGRDGTIAKILKLLSKKNSEDKTTSDFDVAACKEHHLRCPLNLVGMDGFVEY